MLKIKRITAVLMIICLLISFGIFTACSSDKTHNDNKKLSIVCTIFPEYDWVRAILGNMEQDAELTLLLDNGVDLHNYQPTADDIIKISNCDMFIYVGGESDEWVEDILKGAKNDDMIIMNLLDTLGDSVKTEEIVEGMQEDEHHEHDNEEEHEEHEEYDEHVWLSLKNAEYLCQAIADKLTVIDTENKEVYTNNANAYIEKLKALDTEYQNAVDNAVRKTVLFGDRFPFRYLVDDYELEYYAAFAGCSAETEASFETIAFLADKVNELNLSCVLTIEGSDHKIAETIIANTDNKNQTILSLNSIQSVTSTEVNEGVTYLSIMESNLDVLKDALK